MEDYIGKEFGRITVLENAGYKIYPGGEKRFQYKCRCSCGKICELTRQYLQDKRRKSKSCGCVNDENRTALGLSKRKLPPREATAKIVFDQTYADGNLTFEDFLQLSQMNCYYCQAAPVSRYNKYLHRQQAKVSEYARQEGTFVYNGLDRIDSSLPHNKDNVVTACITCNRCKSNTNVEDFRAWIIRIYENWAKEKAW